MDAGKVEPTAVGQGRQGIDLGLIVLLAFTLIVPFTIGSAHRIFEDGDVSWHVATGRWIIEHGRIPFTDPFSFSGAGNKWIAHEWLPDVLMATVYNFAGLTGLALLVIAALSALMLVIGRELLRRIGPIETAMLLTAVTISLIPFLLARPMVLTWPVLAFWTVSLMHAREQRRAPPLWLVGVMLLWANSHLSFALGLALIGPFALEALIEEPDKKRVIIGWGAFGLLCTAAGLLNPNGLEQFLMPLTSLTSDNITLIQEFKPTDMSFTPGFEYALLLVLAMCLGRGAKIPPLRLLLLLGMLHLAFQHMRHQALFMIIAALLVAAPLGLTDQARPRSAPNRAAARRFALIGAGAFALLAVLRLVQPLAPPDSPTNPNAALASLPPHWRDLPMLNSYSFGGPLILKGFRPFIDGRTEVYGEEFVVNYQKLLDGNQAAFDAAQRRWNFRWALISREDKNLMRLIERSGQWRRVRADRYAVTYVRR